MKKDKESREYVVTLLKDWISSGALVNKKEYGMSYQEMDRRIKRRELFPTGLRGTICTDEDVARALDELVRERRVMTMSMCKYSKGYLTQYSVNLAAADGKVARVADLGKGAVLFVD